MINYRKIFDTLSSGIIKNNLKFSNRHESEECYLFGNGVSLKFFDLDKFSDKISFGCNELRIHNEVSSLNLRYYVSMHSLLYCKYWRGVKSGLHIEKNPLYSHVHTFNDNDYEMFVHVSNYPFTKKYNNFNYLHNFKKNEISLDTLDFTSSSSFARGGLVTMIGLAIYMGFKKIYLVGCDYWFKPMRGGHFYGDNEGYDAGNNFLYEELMDVIKNKVELTVVTRNGVRSYVNYVEYSELTGVDEKKHLVDHIISPSHADVMRKSSYLRGG